MNTTLQQTTKKTDTVTFTKQQIKKSSLYVLSVITRKIQIPYQYVGSNLKEIIQKKLSSLLEGKCAVEGYIRSNSVRIITYSSGILKANNVVFDVVFECLICTPVEGMILNPQITNITKAGLRCDIMGEESPLDIFIARDHHHTNKEFSKLNVGDKIRVKVLGQRYEINDPTISVIAELMKQPRKKRSPKKPLLVIEE